MIQFQVGYKNEEDFRDSLRRIRCAYDAKQYSEITFYLTWTETAGEELDKVAFILDEMFPEAYYYGNEASGNIARGEFTLGIHVTCYIYEGKDTGTELVWVEQGTAVSSLKDLWEYCNTKQDLAAVEMIPSVSYLDILEIDGNIPDISRNVQIFGGSSINYDVFASEAYIIAKGHGRSKNGMVVILYFGTSLGISTSSVLGWKGLGRLMKVTNSNGKCIREIDNVPAYSIYEKYLNLSLEDKDTLVFPLITEEDGYEYIRTPKTIYPDRSMLMFANIPNGTSVRIAYGDKNTILDGIYDEAKEIAGLQPEAIRAYSCAARRLFWGDSEVGRETQILETLAPVNGFYTGGEILRFGDKLRVLNQTLAIVTMRETCSENSAHSENLLGVRAPDKSLVARLAYFTQKVTEEQEAAHHQLEENVKIISGLATQFDVLHVISLDEETFITYIQKDEINREISQAKAPEMHWHDFFLTDVIPLVHPEYVDSILKLSDRSYIRDALKNRKRISARIPMKTELTAAEYLWQDFVVIKLDEIHLDADHIAMGYINVDEQVKKEQEHTESERLHKELLDQMMSDDTVYLIDCVRNTRKTVHDRLGWNALFSDQMRYSDAFNTYIDTYVAGVDREMLRTVAAPSYMQNRLKNEPEYTVRYRDSTKGIQKFYEMRVARFSDTEVLQSFKENDRKIVERLIFDKIEESYFAILVVDLDSGLLQVMKNDSGYLDKVGTIKPYTPMLLNMASNFEGETREFFEKISDIHYLQQRFARDDKATYTYKSHLVKGFRWVDVAELVIARHEEGTPSLFALLFSYLDDEASKMQEVQQKLKEDTQIIGALTLDFTCVFYVELRNNQTDDNTVEIRTSELVKKLIPVWEQETNFARDLELLRDYLVYEPDREQFFEETKRDTIVEKLQNTDTYFCNTRFVIEGEIRYYQFQFSAVWDKGQIQGYVAGLRSIDEQMKKEIEAKKRLQEALTVADSASKSKSSFLFNMSHDIRTPMNAIKGFTVMAKKYVDDMDKVRDYLDKIDIAGEQLLTLINQVLEMSRIETGKIEFNEQPVNIRERFESMVTIVSAHARSKGLTLNPSLKDITHFRVMADDSRMGQITINILGNAIKYTPEGGSIDFILAEIPTRKKGYASYTFTVADTGIGMSKEYLEKLFEPFSREKNSTVSRIQGTGLGMSIVKNLVDLKKGTIQVESEKGKGTRFDITLDFRLCEEDETPDSLEAVNEECSSISFEGKRVLLVEDNEMNCEIARDVLEEYGFLVEEASDGDIAVEMYKNSIAEKKYGYYDFILMDIQMPRMNGYEATRAIRAIPAQGTHIPIIAMTANAFEEDRKDAVAAGMDDHLSKPIEIQKMLDTLTKYLRS